MIINFSKKIMYHYLYLKFLQKKKIQYTINKCKNIQGTKYKVYKIMSRNCLKVYFIATLLNIGPLDN